MASPTWPTVETAFRVQYTYFSHLHIYLKTMFYLTDYFPRPLISNSILSHYSQKEYP